MKFARAVFGVAGVSGLVILAPFYFKAPPMETAPEFYYGFVGVAIAWQIAFLFIATDPMRYRWMMVPSALEKISFAAAVFALHSQGRLASPVAAGCMDAVFAAFFVVSFFLAGRE